MLRPKIKDAAQAIGYKGGRSIAFVATSGLTGGLTNRNHGGAGVTVRDVMKGAQSMQEIAELERRITAALARIGAGLDRQVATPPPAPVMAAPTTGSEALLRSELDEERMLTAQLQERIKVISAREAALREAKPAEVKAVHVPVAQAQLEARIDKMTRQLDVQGLELQRMRKVTVQLREQLARLRQAAEAGTTEPHLINKAMLAELDALRAARASEVAEMDEILAELSPLIGAEG